MWDKLHAKYPNNKLFTVMANKKIKALVYLIMWLIFIFFICVIYIKPASEYLNNVSSNEVSDNNDKKDIDTSVSFAVMKQKLLEKNFSYVYKHNNDEVYRGDSLGNQNSGYQESSEGIRRYYLDGEHEYDVSFGVYKEIDYEELFKTYFNIDYLFSLMNDQWVIVFDNTVSFTSDDLNIKIFNNNKNIEKIEITKDDEFYSLEFNNIGQITEIVK